MRKKWEASPPPSPTLMLRACFTVCNNMYIMSSKVLLAKNHMIALFDSHIN